MIRWSVTLRPPGGVHPQRVPPPPVELGQRLGRTRAWVCLNRDPLYAVLRKRFERPRKRDRSGDSIKIQAVDP